MVSETKRLGQSRAEPSVLTSVAAHETFTAHRRKAAQPYLKATQVLVEERLQALLMGNRTAARPKNTR
jgi:hypothetical protein